MWSCVYISLHFKRGQVLLILSSPVVSLPLQSVRLTLCSNGHLDRSRRVLPVSDWLLKIFENWSIFEQVHFGPICSWKRSIVPECPGSALDPCNGHGDCDDGRSGSGVCSCSGIHYGPKCDCLNGTCATGNNNVCDKRLSVSSFGSGVLDIFEEHSCIVWLSERNML